MTAARDVVQGSCPACREPLFGWVLTPTKAPYRDYAVVDRCENCGLAAARGEATVDVIAWLAELADMSPGDLMVAPEVEFDQPNLASLQGALGEGRWTALDADRPLHLTPRSITLLLREAGLEVESIHFPKVGRNTRWFLQTGLNAVTFNPDFAREAKAGRLRPSGLIESFKFAVDTLITLLAGALTAPLVLIAEALAATVKRGGRMIVRARRS